MVMSKSKNAYSTSGNVALKVQRVEKQKVKRVKKVKKAVKQNTSKEVKAKLKAIGVVAVLFLFSIYTLSRFAFIMKLNADVRNIKHEIATLKKENENLLVEIANNNNIKLIENIAVNQYNMINPKAEEVKFVDVKPIEVNKKENITAYQIIQKVIGFIN